jgi:prepilin-type N-terminal cleavage/methylation domain-containing protein
MHYFLRMPFVYVYHGSKQRRMSMEKAKGFTLIEIMIVVAIIALLAMLAVPTAMRFLAKTKRTEAYMNLSSIYAAQKAYWAEHGKYSDILNGPGGIGWKPEGYQGGGAQENFNYTYGFPGGEGRNYFTGKLAASSSGLSGAKADGNSFIVYAVGDIDGDGKPDILCIDHRNTIRVVQDDLAD